ncbi:MAG: putative glycosidase [Desertimonas sp.]|nr:putative glycosidase [Desertimonas sp.]
MGPDAEPVLHRPFGAGHPYRVDPDQRHPVVPVLGEPLELRVLVGAGVDAVWAELEPSGISVPLMAFGADELYPAAETAEGHLAAASGARPDLGGRTIWRAVIEAVDAVEDGPLRYRFRWRSHWTGGTTEWFEAWPGSWAASSGGELVVDDQRRVVDGSVEWLVTARGPVRMRFAMHLGPGEHVCGFGERFDAVDQRGRRLDTMVFEQYKQQGTRTYLPSPFAIVAGGEGWGFHIRTSRRCWFDVGAGDVDRLAVDVALSHIEPEAHPVVEVAVYAGHPAEVLAAHLDEIGRPVAPPAWVFRPWMSGNEWNTQARVLAEVERSVELGIPVGVVVIEAWSDESTFVVFPDDGRFPDPEAMVDRLHELGVKVLLWQIPLVPTDRDPAGQVAVDAATMIERGYCVRDGDGLPYRNRGWWFPGALLVDWTNSEAAEWWLSKRRYMLDEVGIDGFKTDGGEHAWGDELRYHDGSRGDTSNNLYPLRYAQAYHRLLDDRGTDGVTFSRAGFTGAGSAPCHWAGDEDSTWEAFRASIVAGLTAGISGVPFWGWDLAGFSGDVPTVELYVRAAAMAALCPIMQYHSEFNQHRQPSNDRTPWNLAERHGDQRAIDLYRRFAVLRDRLSPWLIRWAEDTVTTGVPMMRPLWFDDPGDPSTWEAPYHYRFGPELVVSPVCWPDRHDLDVYLPTGDWVDLWTGEPVAGSAWLRRDVPWEVIPVYCRRAAADALRPAFQTD